MRNFAEEGRFIAMDLGGTNLRVMLMDIIPGEELKTEQFNTRIPNWAMHGTGEQLFDYITKCLAEFLIEKGVQNDGLPVGFTFSYPCDQKSLRSATLLRWTKGFEASGVVGEDVVKLLEKSIAKRSDINVEVVALINDTVGTMVAAAHETGGHCHIGVIIATGTNASYMEDISKVKYGLSKSATDYKYPAMIIDTEWGGFGDNAEADYILTQYDKIVDSFSEHPGVNTFDKLVGGKCMGEVVRVVLEKLTRAAIACILNRIRKKNMTVGIDGSTYKYHPFFDFWVHDKLKELVDPGIKYKLIQTADGSGKGAALITAIISRLNKRKQQQQCKIDNHMISIGKNVEQINEIKENGEESMKEKQNSRIDDVNLVTGDMSIYESFNGEIQNGRIHLPTL
ncbi:Hexokinase [Onchocerca flexuosa]|uniref:Phosphotransferase n=2 Tax=Onchocerca flexuosa TaxID=387005 RepID=A0A238BN99_9BILA|nr:Hexokinase [Onchocerca flexuosa]